jgi:hypothetical protein
MDINTFDIDGVIFINKECRGVHPGPRDHIITGRSFQETNETMDMLRSRGISNVVHFNPLPYEAKTRESSGHHKAVQIAKLKSIGYNVVCHFEDDEIQSAIIKAEHPDVNLIMIVHDLTNKENQRNHDF